MFPVLTIAGSNSNHYKMARSYLESLEETSNLTSKNLQASIQLVQNMNRHKFVQTEYALVNRLSKEIDELSPKNLNLKVGFITQLILTLKEIATQEVASYLSEINERLIQLNERYNYAKIGIRLLPVSDKLMQTIEAASSRNPYPTDEEIYSDLLKTNKIEAVRGLEKLWRINQNKRYNFSRASEYDGQSSGAERRGVYKESGRRIEADLGRRGRRLVRLERIHQKREAIINENKLNPQGSKKTDKQTPISNLNFDIKDLAFTAEQVQALNNELSTQQPEDNTSALSSSMLKESSSSPVAAEVISSTGEVLNPIHSKNSQLETPTAKSQLVVYDSKAMYRKHKSLKSIIKELNNDRSKEVQRAAENIDVVISEFFSDERANIKIHDQIPDIKGRDQELQRLIDVLMRQKGGNPALMGAVFSGKTAIVEMLVDHIIEQKYPDEVPYKEMFEGTHIVRIDGANFSAKEKPVTLMRNYLEAVMQLNELRGIGIITYITNSEQLPQNVIK
jgi:hypothetical protein